MNYSPPNFEGLIQEFSKKMPNILSRTKKRTLLVMNNSKFCKFSTSFSIVIEHYHFEADFDELLSEFRRNLQKKDKLCRAFDKFHEGTCFAENRSNIWKFVKLFIMTYYHYSLIYLIFICLIISQLTCPFPAGRSVRDEVSVVKTTSTAALSSFMMCIPRKFATSCEGRAAL